MEINVDKCVFVDTENFMANLIDSSCGTSGYLGNFTVRDDFYFQLETSLDSCGTFVSSSDDEKVTFSQTVFATADSGPIFVGNPIELSFQCVYDRNADTSTDGDFDRITTNTGASGQGNFQFELVVYEDDTFDQLVPEGDVIIVGERVHFGVRSSSLPDTVSFMVTDCTISNADFGLSYSIITEMCPDPITRTQFHEEGPFSKLAKVSYDAFRFDTGTNEDHEEELSCQIIVCDNEKNDSICNSPPSCDRRRRSAGHLAANSKIIKTKINKTFLKL